ncbi:MAG: nucleoside triphosphate pyrophosphohydrolase [Anaerolineae bacterium]|jgi:tetrapyrrole methylase family protein/MazG family protein|nr:nucleoside triphosphate pyrophosphohydrolase [Anaerolineae bacterium]
MTITIVGLGAGDVHDLTRRAWKALETSPKVYLRTRQHPCVPDLPNSAAYVSFDAIYERFVKFEEVYQAIVDQILTDAQHTDLVYAVPGDPFVGEATTRRIMEGAQSLGISVEIVHGISFIEPMLRYAGIDAIDHLQILDAITVGMMHHPPINPDAPALIAQVYNRQIASELKLTLMNQYPDEFPLKLIHRAGTGAVNVESLKLHEIDHSEQIGHLTSLYLPALGGMSSFEQFQEVIAHLRAPEGCPWDRAQTHESLRPFLIEEVYEVLEAIDSGDMAALAEEFGDLLLQIVLHTQIAIEHGEFYMTDILSHISRKMIRRHPHVWGTTEVNGNAAQVLANWEAIKRAEKQEQGQPRESILDGAPKGLPAMMLAYRYQAKAAKVGFDWDHIEDVFAKVQEELEEVRAAQTPEQRFEEIGDLLFALINWIRFLQVDDPESALREANLKFYRRFRHIEQRVSEQGKDWKAYTLTELDHFWNEAKALGL